MVRNPRSGKAGGLHWQEPVGHDEKRSKAPKNRCGPSCMKALSSESGERLLDTPTIEIVGFLAPSSVSLSPTMRFPWLDRADSRAHCTARFESGRGVVKGERRGVETRVLFVPEFAPVRSA